MSIAMLLVLTACIDSSNEKLKVDEQNFVLTTSIHELMVSVVDPAADAIWQSVSTTVTADTVEEEGLLTKRSGKC